MNTVNKSEAEWREQLDEQTYAVTREGGTERAFTGCFWDCKTPGVYSCVCCGGELFASDSKYDSGSGWPSFFQPISPDVISEHQDASFGRVRTEVRCGSCDAHLGHLFNDGPKPTGMRYCVNSVCLTHRPEDK
ncbi:MAG: peptide-methionine (R)-S-oxide reductase [Rhodothermales bacterium]|jgi:peptide-methionine (R)-S-oxide reductase